MSAENTDSNSSTSTRKTAGAFTRWVRNAKKAVKAFFKSPLLTSILAGTLMMGTAAHSFVKPGPTSIFGLLLVFVIFVASLNWNLRNMYVAPVVEE